MKKLILLATVVMLALTAAAYNFKVNGLCYNYNSDGKSVTVTYQQFPPEANNGMAYNNLIGSLKIPSSVTYGGKTYSVTSIGDDAFGGCSGLTSVTIPDSVTTIGGGAFYWCDGLTSVTIPNSVTTIGGSAFYGCGGLTSVTIPNSVTTIGGSAFGDCRGLTSVTIGNSVTTIRSEAFVECYSLTSVNITDLAAWCKTSFGDDEANPLYYAHHLYINGTEVKDLVIPSSVTTIGGRAFAWCSGLTSVTIPNSVTTIGSSAFSGCSGLTGNLTIPNSVTRIGKYAFSDCSGLTSIIIGNSVTEIGANAFYLQDGNNRTLTLTGGIQSIGDNAFRDVSTLILKDEVTMIKNLGVEPNVIYSYVDNPPACDNNSFRNYNGTLHVPKRAFAAYVDAPYWSNFGNIVNDAVEPETLEWDYEDMTLKLGDQLVLEAPYLTPDNTGLEIDVRSSDPDVVNVSRNYNDNTYTIQGIKVGEADIVATCMWLESRIHVTITENVITIALDKHEVEMEAGTMVTLTPSSTLMVEFTAESSDRSVATARVVDGRVQVVAAKPGEAIITVGSTDGKAVPDTCKVTVIRPCGDLSNDGYVDVSDVNIMIDMVLGKAEVNLSTADLNGDGVIDVSDVNKLIDIVLGKD